LLEEGAGVLGGSAGEAGVGALGGGVGGAGGAGALGGGAGGAGALGGGVGGAGALGGVGSKIDSAPLTISGTKFLKAPKSPAILFNRGNE
jgi:hypothetical protein